MTPGLVSVGYLHPGHYAACFAESLTELLFHDAVNHQRVVSHRWGKLVQECGSGGIVDGRNKLATLVLDESDSEWLFMVDSDMGFECDIVDKLIEAADPVDRPVVGGLAFANKTDGRSSFYGIRYRPIPTLYDFHEDGDKVGFVPRLEYPRGELVEVAATGGACMLIHRSVLEQVRDKYGPIWFDTIRHPKGAHFSEDLAFCVRLAGAGIPLYVHTGIRTTHDKGNAFLDEEYFDSFMQTKGG